MSCIARDVAPLPEHSRYNYLVGLVTVQILHDMAGALMIASANSEFALSALDAAHPARERLEDAYAALVEIDKLRSWLLSFARGECGARQLVDLGCLVERSAPILRRLLSTDIAITVERGGLALVEVDPISIERVLLNLVLNARDAIGETGFRETGDWRLEAGEVVPGERLTETTTPYQPPASSLQPQGRPLASSLQPPGNIAISTHGDERAAWLVVRDDGCGMAPEVLARIFEPFFTTKGAQGTGLGLAACREIVEGYGGSITVESAVGQGTTVRVSLPAAWWD